MSAINGLTAVVPVYEKLVQRGFVFLTGLVGFSLIIEYGFIPVTQSLNFALIGACLLGLSTILSFLTFYVRITAQEKIVPP